MPHLVIPTAAADNTRCPRSRREIVGQWPDSRSGLHIWC